MGPYSHYVLAAKMEPSIRPEDRRAYYWGAVVPDVRYVANMRREQTHLDLVRLKELTGRYPHLRSFLLGYQVHILCDQVDVARIVSATFPINWLNTLRRKSLSSQQVVMLVEMNYLKTAVDGDRLSGDHNAVLDLLGITPEQTGIFHQALQEYFDRRSAEAAIATFLNIGWIKNDRVEKYLRAYHSIEKRGLMSAVMMSGVKNARLDARVMDHIRANLDA